MNLDDKAVGITWEEKEEAEKLNVENQYLEFRRRIVNEVFDKIFVYCGLIMVVSILLIVGYYFGFFTYYIEGQTIPILGIIEGVWLHLQSLPIQILLLIIIFIISSVLIIFFGSCYVSKSQVIVLGKEKKEE